MTDKKILMLAAEITKRQRWGFAPDFAAFAERFPDDPDDDSAEVELAVIVDEDGFVVSSAINKDGMGFDRDRALNYVRSNGGQQIHYEAIVTARIPRAKVAQVLGTVGHGTAVGQNACSDQRAGSASQQATGQQATGQQATGQQDSRWEISGYIAPTPHTILSPAEKGD